MVIAAPARLFLVLADAAQSARCADERYNNHLERCLEALTMRLREWRNKRMGNWPACVEGSSHQN